jgi:NAD(P)-dependent dehydrogenase (short-subunit alcohol dehydrogenase family)
MTAIWTSHDIPSQAGRTALVTGANSGLGFFTAQELARRGARVLLACRSKAKAEAAKQAMLREVPEGRLECVDLDLSNLQSVRAVAEAFVSRGEALDLLVNNAGIMAIPERTTTADGFEMQFGTNHLGHFALTGHLLPALKLARAPRVVTVSSVAHRRGRIDFENLQGEKKYSAMAAYGQSKLANLMFALEFQRRVVRAGSPIASVGAHPGISNTNLFDSGPLLGVKGGLRPLLRKAFPLKWTSQPPEQGALPQLYAATAPAAMGGMYIGPDGLLEFFGYPAPAKVSSRGQDTAVAARLWEVSERLTGVAFGI